ncbi:MAG: HAD family hydrolase [Patescibacteria group bacterium]
MIKHIWFDFSDTLASISKEHDDFLYQSYAKVVGKDVSPELILEYKEMHKKFKSNSAVFTTDLGLPPGYWAKCIESKDPRTMYVIKDSNIPNVLNKLRKIIPISIFSNMKMEKLLPAIGLDISYFTYTVSGSDFKNPKPALDGFYKIIEVSKLPPENILFIGDSVEKEIIPVKKVGMIAGLMWSSSPEADYNFKNFSEILDLFI